jgi:DNA-3-methyladenine glycosylase I
MTLSLQRCHWCEGDELYEHYHDHEWGVPSRDARLLFEMLTLEGAQAGLSWITILRKRKRYREVFAHFDAKKIAAFTENDVERLMQDAGIVRHRRKIESVIGNANALLAMQQQGENIVDFLWQFAERESPTRYRLTDVPSQTAASMAMSRALKKRGFNFVGPTICYAFMQACGMVNDHLIDCHRHSACRALAAKIDINKP